MEQSLPVPEARTDIKEYTYGDKIVKISQTVTRIEVDILDLKVDDTGSKVWQIADPLCQYISQHSELFAGKNVVELGSGPGLCGIVAGGYCRRVLLTDGDERVLAILRTNVALNALENASVSRLCWNDDASIAAALASFGDRPDVVLAADVIYHDTHVELVLQTARKLLRDSGGVLIMGHHARWKAISQHLHSRALQLGFEPVHVDFHIPQNVLSANFGFKTILMWRIPASDLSLAPVKDTETFDPDEFEKLFP
eukprot:TRINITY_DN26690_c0_g1_i1.p2 TRINITY_DN26690_c0_g1~~TRINITY_DN26690_c0_g1_i1.p2  ORF type:complete len:254 (-),score=58.08 TRINITY_DN26690_c0_g1_i1:875-1636(-)